MPDRELRKPYEPNPVLRALYRHFFDRIRVEDAWVDTVRRLSERGVVVYVLRSLNLMDFLALDHLTKRYELPRIHFVNDLRLGILNPSVGREYRALLKRLSPSERLRATIGQGASSVLFLKRPPGVLDVAAGASAGRGLREGDELVQALFDAAGEVHRPVLLLPQVFLWTRRPDTRGARPLDMLLGPREWPSSVRTALELLENRPGVELRSGAPLDLDAFLRSNSGVDDTVLIRRVTYAMLRRLERERRSAVGPAHKSPERVRQEIMRSPILRAEIDQLATETSDGEREVRRQAWEMLRTLQATPDHTAVTALDFVFHRVFHRIYAGIEHDPLDLERVREAAKDHTLILLPSHKSHVDYLLLSYLFRHAGLPVPVIASGENMNFFPVGNLLRRGGAFFIRRSFKGDRLYGAVVAAYVRRLIRDGYPIELFLEGGRSRTGKLLPPKYGMLSMIADAALAMPHRPTCFVPVSIGYERVVEAAAYERELRGGDKQKEDASRLLQSREVLRHRYGRINLQVGRILSLNELCEQLGLPPPAQLDKQQRRRLISRLANQVMDEINRVTAVTPGALAALILLSHSAEALAHAELYARCDRLLKLLRSLGARVTPAAAAPGRPLRDAALVEAAQMFLDAELLHAHPADDGKSRRRWRRTLSQAGPGAVYTVPVNKRLALDTSKNIILHFLVERAFVATAALAPSSEPVDVELVRRRVEFLSRLFKHEFRFHAGTAFDDILDETLRRMAHAGELRVGPNGQLEPGDGRDGWTGGQWLHLYLETVLNFLEGYRAAARGLVHLLRGPMSEKDLVKRTLSTGTRMFLAREIRRREAVSKPIVANAIRAFGDLGYLESQDTMVSLSEAHRSQVAIDAIEQRLAALLPEDE